MTPTSEVIRLAQAAQIISESDVSAAKEGITLQWTTEEVARLISLAKAEEREAFALVCEAIEDDYQRTESRKWPELKSDAEAGANRCAYDIRARTKEAP